MGRAVDFRLAPWTGLRKARSSTRERTNVTAYFAPSKARFICVSIGVWSVVLDPSSTPRARSVLVRFLDGFERSVSFESRTMLSSGRSVSFRKASWQGARRSDVKHRRSGGMVRTRPGMGRSTRRSAFSCGDPFPCSSSSTRRRRGVEVSRSRSRQKSRNAVQNTRLLRPLPSRCPLA
jgi:hypothetical protein